MQSLAPGETAPKRTSCDRRDEFIYITLLRLLGLLVSRLAGSSNIAIESNFKVQPCMKPSSFLLGFLPP